MGRILIWLFWGWSIVEVVIDWFAWVFEHFNKLNSNTEILMQISDENVVVSSDKIMTFIEKLKNELL